MNLLCKCLSYVVIAGGLSLGFFAGAQWLIAPDPAAADVTPARSIPPRIADSIARKHEAREQSTPQSRQEPARETPAALHPALQEANAALHPDAPVSPARAVMRGLNVGKPKLKRAARAPARPPAVPAPVAPSRALVTTARSDVPY
jgi:hypothetical protein